MSTIEERLEALQTLQADVTFCKLHALTEALDIRTNERDALRASIAADFTEAYSLLAQAGALLEALRLESGIGNILGNGERAAYKQVDDGIRAILARVKGEGS